jgi:putative redox protein
MKVTLKRIDDSFNFEATGQSSVKNYMDAGEAIGGQNNGARPMEMLLMGLGGCTAIDVTLILKKQKQQIDDLTIEVSGERTEIEGTQMTPFKSMNIHFIFTGEIDEKKIERAINLSMEKYCSATAQLQCSATITHSFELLSK